MIKSLGGSWNKIFRKKARRRCNAFLVTFSVHTNPPVNFEAEINTQQIYLESRLKAGTDRPVTKHNKPWMNPYFVYTC